MKVNTTKDYIHTLKRRIDLVRVFGLMDKKDDCYRKGFIAQIEKLKELLNRLLVSSPSQ